RATRAWPSPSGASPIRSWRRSACWWPCSSASWPRFRTRSGASGGTWPPVRPVLPRLRLEAHEPLLELVHAELEPVELVRMRARPWRLDPIAGLLLRVERLGEPRRLRLGHDDVQRDRLPVPDDGELHRVALRVGGERGADVDGVGH